MSIDIYHDYTLEGLRDELMGGIEVGDADGLHNALIVMCNIIKSRDARIVKLEKKVYQLEADKPSPEFQEYREKRERWAKQCEESMRLSEGR